MAQAEPQPLQPGLAPHLGLESFWLCRDILEDEDPELRRGAGEVAVLTNRGQSSLRPGGL